MTAKTQVDFYLRLSIDREGKDSLARQEADLRAWAKREGLTVRKVWKDASKSGYKVGVVREEFDNAVKAVASGAVGTLAVWKLDRLSRRGAGQVGLILDKVEQAGGRLFFYKDSLDSTVPGHRMVIVMVSEQARTESANTSLRVKAQIESANAEGKPKAGVRPFGWEVDGMTIRESEAVHIREAYRLVLEEGVSVWKLAKEWTALGIKTDGMGRSRRVRAGEDPRVAPGVWTTTTMRQVLVRPRNAGLLVVDGAELPNSQIQPIVTREEWAALTQSIKGVNTLRGPKPQYLLGGILECICGQTMHASKSVSGRKGQKRSYQIYRCRVYGMDTNVQHTTIQLEVADMVVRDWVVEDIGLGLGKPVEVRDDLVAVQARLAAVAAEESRATDMIMDGLGNAAQIKGRLKALKEERVHLEEERDAILAESAHGSALSEFRNTVMELPDLATDAELDAQFAKGFRAWDALSMEARRAIIRGGYRVKVTAGGRGPDRVKVTPR